ncbi:MAG: ParB/RepB/Spo0J family partition protein [bacterium]|nr:ParB/RepB/Spo0J family partition protein [bacterium]
MAKKSVTFDINPLFGGPSLADRSRATNNPYKELSIADIDVDPDQPRRVFDSEALSELSLSIKEYGVLTPILVRMTHVGTYRLIAGERRLRAAKMAGMEYIPAIVEQQEEVPDRTLAKQLVENIQRQDLTPLERAVAIGQLRDSHGLSMRDIATKLGVSKGTVQRSLEILALPDDLKDALASGASESKILMLSQVSDAERRANILMQLDHLTREDLDALIRGDSPVASEKKRKKSASDVANVRISPEDRRIMEEMQKSLGVKVQLSRVKDKDGHGKISIEFYSPEDLYEIYRRVVIS